MAQIEFVVPEAIINYFTNPRLGTGDTTGLTLVGSAISSVLTRARWGIYSVLVNTAGAVVNEGVFATTTFLLGTEGTWAGSVYVRGEGTVRLRLRDNTNGVEVVSEAVVLNDDRWIRMEVNGAFPAGLLDMQLYVETTTIQDVNFYVDGIQIEPNGYVTTYVDGDRELELPPHDGYTFYQWNGTIHASTSSRSADFRSGGKTEVIENVDTELLITDMDGLGMPPISLHISQFASMDRARIDSWRAIPRVVNLHFFARRRVEGQPCFPADLSELHEQRQKLETIVKPDKALGAQPILMRYSDGHDDERKVEIFVYYEGGLEWSGDIRWPYINDFVVRFLAVDPYWYEDTQDVHSPTGTGIATLTDADFIIARIDGEWAEPGIGGTNGNVYKIAVHPTSGDIYVGGAFTTIDGATPNTARIARWDGTDWNSLGGAGNILDGTVRAIDFLANGDVIIGGQFTNVGAVANNFITRYDPGADTFSTMGGVNPGFDESVRDFAVNDAGFAYAVGTFAFENGGGVRYNFIALYNPVANTFAQVGAGAGLNSSAFCASMDNDGIKVYVGGLFDTEFGGVANVLDSLTQFDPVNSFQPMGTGLNAAVSILDILCTHDNRVYAVGEFTHVGFIDANYIGVWNGREWYPLGVEGDGFTLDGAGSGIRALHENYKNLLFIGGDIDGATDSPLFRGFGSWDRSRFQQWDMVMPTNHVYTVATRGDDIWLGFNNNGTSLAAEVFTIENIGRTITYPTLEILGPCYIEWFENQTTGQIVRLDLDILAGERVVFDFKPWNRFVRSTLRGNVIKSILADSDEIHFLPGENVLAMFCESTDGNTEISLRWPIIHWGFDDLR